MWTLNPETGAQLFFSNPTPGWVNDVSSVGFAENPRFSMPGGVYTNSSLALTLSVTSPTAVIYHTLNGTEPTEASALYSTPIGLSQASLTAALCAGPLTGFAYLVWFLARFDSWAARILSTSTMIAGGEISYSIYLLHPFVLSWFLKPEMDFSAANFGLWLAIMATAIGAVVVMSYGTWALIEVPCRRWLRNTLTSTRPIAELAESVSAKRR